MAGNTHFGNFPNDYGTVRTTGDEIFTARAVLACGDTGCVSGSRCHLNSLLVVPQLKFDVSLLLENMKEGCTLTLII